MDRELWPAVDPHGAHAVRCFRSLGEQTELFAYESPYRIDEVLLEASGIREFD